MSAQPRWVHLCLAAALGAVGCAGQVGEDGTFVPTSASVGPLVRAGSGKCLDVKDGQTADGAALQQWSCSGGPNQSFRLDDAGGGHVKIVHASSSKCVDVAAAGTANNTKVQLYRCNGTAAQTWVTEDRGGGYVQLRNPHSNRCLDVVGASNDDGAGVQIYDCNGTSAQSWQVAPPSGGGGGAGGGGGSSGFVHPGVLVDKGQLDFVKAKIAAKQQPWYNAYNDANGSNLGSLSYTPHPRADVQCGPTSNPDIGCTDEKNDSAAAYTQALLWYYGGNKAHADKAIQIMNAWASTITTHELSNAPLESAWVASLWPRAAEIIRYTYDGWAASDIATFENMLKKVYLPEVVNGSSSNGNWELSMIEATIGIGVFLDDQATFDKAVAMWKKRVPAYMYLTSDGATPVPPETGNANSPSALHGFWYNPIKYVQGMAQETCRDYTHVQYGLSAATNAAETAWIQGVDLYSLEKTRLAAAYEFHSQFINGSLPKTTAICTAGDMSVSHSPMWEIAYNALANRLGVALPQTQKVMLANRPTGNDHQMEWETLTHADIGNAGAR
jgi:ricin-type beta-trefoil lectin protein/alginate lyase